MNVLQTLKIVGELGFVDVRSNATITVTPPAINLHQARMNPFVHFLQDYVQAHPGFRFKGYFTLYDAWREHAEPSDSPEFALLPQSLLKMFIGTGTLGEPGRFIQPYHLKDLFPVFGHPVLAFGRHKNDPFVQLVPDTDFIHTGGYAQLKDDIDANDCEWQHKQPRLFWRGSMHGFAYKAYDPSQMKSQRALLVEWSLRHTAICDAQCSHTSLKREQLHHKYLIDIDGEVNAWSGLFWKLYSNSVVFKVLSHYEQWYYHKLIPWIHFIPVQGNLADLKEKFEWAVSHDDECRRIAQAGRDFAADLTYQQQFEAIQLSNNTKDLHQRHHVVKRTALPQPLLKNPVVVHTYQPACQTVSQPPGLGDFLRGTVALFQLSRIYQFELRLDFTSHTLSQLVQLYDTIPGIGKQKVHEFFNQKNSELEPYLAGLSGRRNVFVLTHAVPAEPIDDDCRAFILKRLQPVSMLTAYLETVRTELCLNQFCTVHLRMGDHLIGKNAPSLPIIDRWFRERILPRWGTNVLVISDNSGIKDALQKQFGIRIISTKPVHLGQCLPTEVDRNDVHDTLAEFLLMAQSDQIYQYSVYPWGSGFSDLCAALFDIPLEKITGEHSESGRKILMPTPKISEDNGVTRKVLNVGGNSKAIAIPACFNSWQHDLLDIDPRGNPDVLCDARELWRLPPRQYDAIYCSHNLEHYHKHDVRNVLKGFRLILKKGGYALIKVPDIRAVMQRVINEGLDIDDVLYHCPSGPILVSDVIYGWHVEIERSGNDFFAHKTGYTVQSLDRILKENGFPFVFSRSENLEVTSLAFMQQPGEEQLKQFGFTQHY